MSSPPPPLPQVTAPGGTQTSKPSAQGVSGSSPETARGNAMPWLTMPSLPTPSWINTSALPTLEPRWGADPFPNNNQRGKLLLSLYQPPCAPRAVGTQRPQQEAKDKGKGRAEAEPSSASLPNTGTQTGPSHSPSDQASPGVSTAASAAPAQPSASATTDEQKVRKKPSKTRTPLPDGPRKRRKPPPKGPRGGAPGS